MMIKRIILFPEMATAYRQQKGIEIQVCEVSRPGMPVRKQTGGYAVLWLKDGMVTEGSRW